MILKELTLNQTFIDIDIYAYRKKKKETKYVRYLNSSHDFKRTDFDRNIC